MNTVLRLPAQIERLVEIEEFVSQAAYDLNVDPQALPAVLHALDEAATNVVVHGYQGSPGFIEVEVSAVGRDLTVRLRDQARPFDPTRLRAPRLNLPLSKRKVGGLGVFLMRHYLDDLHYRPLPGGGNELVMVKRCVVPRPS